MELTKIENIMKNDPPPYSQNDGCWGSGMLQVNRVLTTQKGRKAENQY